MNKPTARQDDIVVQDVLDETVIYDRKRDKVHLLNPTAAFVWQHCDGQRTPGDLAALLQQKYQTPQSEDLVWLALDRLEKAHLLAEKVISNERKTITRRRVFKMAGVGIALLPVIKTIVAPTPVQAGSGNGRGSSCTSGNDCASGFCKDNTCM